MFSVGGPYSSLPMGEHIHVFRWGALFMFSVGGPYSGLPLGGFIHVFGELIQSTHFGPKKVDFLIFGIIFR